MKKISIIYFGLLKALVPNKFRKYFFKIFCKIISDQGLKKAEIYNKDFFH